MKMERKTIAILVTLLSVMFCACPGLSLCMVGAITLTQGGTFDFASGTGDPTALIGLAASCLGLLGLLIAALLIFFVWRRKPAPPPNLDEPLPPAI